MPQYSRNSLLGDLGILAPDYSSIVVESSSSQHSGRFLGSLLSVTRVIHDVSSYASETTFPLFDWGDTQNFKLMVLGGLMFGTIGYSDSAPIITMGHSSDEDAILASWTPTGSREVWGMLNSHYNGSFGRGLLVAPDQGPIAVYWDGSSTRGLYGNVSFSVWGYVVPDVESVTS